MKNQGPVVSKIGQQLVADPVIVGGRTVQPVVQIKGWRFASTRRSAAFAAAVLSVAPLEVIVREQDGQESRISITDPTRAALRGIFLSGLLVAATCWLIGWIIIRGAAQSSQSTSRRN